MSKEDVERELFQIIELNFPQLGLEDVLELVEIIGKLYGFDETNIPKMEEYVLSKVSLRERKAVINYNIELYRSSCEKHLDDGESAIKDYIERLQKSYGSTIWKTKAYFSDPEKFDCGEMKEVYIWCE